MQVAAIGVVLALTVFVVLSDVGGGRPRHERINEPRPERRRRLAAVPATSDLPEGNTGVIAVDAGMRGKPDPLVAQPLAVGVEAIQTALRHREVGEAALQPDPNRLIQTEVLEVAGIAARIGALIRLVFWITLAGLGIGLMILGIVRGIALLFEKLLGA